ncbi:MAG: hypothetical protein DCF15_08260 [Phormidesmis priestleyi]|uniref:DUF559 domain-containing protein n=1 Tax=Phormidesmis priestleyi TaxID=268141 RepID=A0A2W4ZP34_9CYAN|nr:MAG: hypothetical protein DCF15_08260 [Phormidesmis priestleyi]
MKNFPIICIPSSLKHAQTSLPPDDPFPGKPPAKPENELQKLAWVALQTSAAAIAASMISSILHIPGWLLFLGAVGVIAYRDWRQHESYHRCKKQYAEELSDYERKKLNHDEKQKTDAPKQIAQWRREQIQSVLNKTVPHDGENSLAKEGKAEGGFRSHLMKYFPGKIHANLTLQRLGCSYQRLGCSYPYTPDAAYIDRSVNLYIDIEVDEPYAYRDNQAIHCDTSEKDLERNQFFKDKGWIVIRFSEQQVVCYPARCCKTVAQQIAQITGDSSILSLFVNIPELPKQRQWTEAEAAQMAIERARDNYDC